MPKRVSTAPLLRGREGDNIIGELGPICCLLLEPFCDMEGLAGLLATRGCGVEVIEVLMRDGLFVILLSASSDSGALKSELRFSETVGCSISIVEISSSAGLSVGGTDGLTFACVRRAERRS